MGNRKLDEALKNEVRHLLHLLSAQTEETYTDKKGTLRLRPRLPIRVLAQKCGLSKNTIYSILDGSSWHWEWLRAEGVLPRPWLLRPSVYGTAKHLRKVAENEFKWRYENKAITRDEHKRLRKQLRQALKPLTGNVSNKAYQVALKLVYVSIKPWDCRRLADGQARIKKRIAKGKRV